MSDVIRLAVSAAIAAFLAGASVLLLGAPAFGAEPAPAATAARPPAITVAPAARGTVVFALACRDIAQSLGCAVF